MQRFLGLVAGAAVAVIFFGGSRLAGDAPAPPEGFVALFNGKDLSGWTVPPGDNGHWKVKNGVIDYDARSEGTGDKCLWSKRPFKDFILRADWRLKTDHGFRHSIPVILPTGLHKMDADGKEEMVEIEDVDSGIYLRGSSKSQVNIWMWPIGSGEVYGYREDAKMPAAVRAGVTPKMNADRPRGEWNTFEITMKGDRLSVQLNGEQVIDNARLPGVPREGKIALQHHGSFDANTGEWTGPPALVQFRNIYIKELAPATGKRRSSVKPQSKEG